MAQALTPGAPGHPPIFATALLPYHVPRPSNSNPEEALAQNIPTSIHDFLVIKQATWPNWDPWRIFEAERVVDVQHGIHEDVLKQACDDDWLQRVVGEHKWNCLFGPVYYNPTNAPLPTGALHDELKAFNDGLRTALRGVMRTVFAGDRYQPEYLGLHYWRVRNEAAPGAEVPAGKFGPLPQPHYDADTAYVRSLALDVVRYENNHVRAKQDHVSLGADDIVAAYSVHFFLHDVNMGGGLAFLLHSTANGDDLRVHEDHGKALVHIGHSPSHIWAAIRRMRREQAMLFCVAHTEGRVCPHAAYPVDHTADGYKPRRSLEIKFFVRERRRPSDQHVKPVPILVAQPAVAPHGKQPAEAKPRSIDRLKAKMSAFLGKDKAVEGERK